MMTNIHHTVLYTGMSGHIVERGWQHKHRLVNGFTKKYNLTKMVYAESCYNVHEAIAREKQIKRWSRKKKERLINEVNADWSDIYEHSFEF